MSRNRNNVVHLTKPYTSLDDINRIKEDIGIVDIPEPTKIVRCTSEPGNFFSTCAAIVDGNGSHEKRDRDENGLSGSNDDSVELRETPYDQRYSWGASRNREGVDIWHVSHGEDTTREQSSFQSVIKPSDETEIDFEHVGLLLSEDPDNNSASAFVPNARKRVYARDFNIPTNSTTSESVGSVEHSETGHWQEEVMRLHVLIDNQNEQQSTQAATIRELLDEQTRLKREIEERESVNPGNLPFMSKDQYDLKMKLLEAECKKQVEEKDVVKAESKALGLTLEQLRDKLIDVQRRIADIERIDETRSTDFYQGPRRENEMGATVCQEEGHEGESTMEFDGEN